MILVLVSCSEQYKIIDTQEFNKNIANRTDITTAEELVQLFYDYPQEGELRFDVTNETLKS